MTPPTGRKGAHWQLPCTRRLAAAAATGRTVATVRAIAVVAVPVVRAVAVVTVVPIRGIRVLIVAVIPVVAVRVGAVLSMLTTGERYMALLPALSVTITVRVCPAPSLVNCSGLLGLLEATPERPSAVV